MNSLKNSPLVRVTDRGLYCSAGDFYIDPWAPVSNALITHAHSDHARVGHQNYFATELSVPILKKRLGADIKIRGLNYREPITLGGVKVSFHSAGHILGSAQIRVDNGGPVWVISGDYKRDSDPSCAPFEVVPCDVFITEATFALPVYRWEPTEQIAAQIYAWWDRNRSANKASVLFCYALGKAQRLLAELAKITDRTVFTHGAVESLVEVYRQAGVAMCPTQKVSEAESPKKCQEFAGELILAPPSAQGSSWMRRFGDADTGFASGWMRIRGSRRRRGYNRGFSLSDHADWPSLLRTVKETGAKMVYATHGYSEILSRSLQESGIEAATLKTTYAGEAET